MAVLHGILESLANDPASWLRSALAAPALVTMLTGASLYAHGLKVEPISLVAVVGSVLDLLVGTLATGIPRRAGARRGHRKRSRRAIWMMARQASVRGYARRRGRTVDNAAATVDKIAARSRQVVDKAVVRPSARPLWFISTRGVCQEERSRDSINGTGPQERNRRSHQRRSERISRTGSTARSQSFEAAAGHGGRSLGSFLCLQRPLGAEHPGPCALRTVAA